MEILVETVGGGTSTKLGGRPSPEDFVKRVPELRDALRRVATGLSEGIDELDSTSKTWGLSEVTVQLEIALAAEAGVIITKTSGSATFRIDLKWTRRALHAGE